MLPQVYTLTQVYMLRVYILRFYMSRSSTSVEEDSLPDTLNLHAGIKVQFCILDWMVCILCLASVLFGSSRFCLKGILSGRRFFVQGFLNRKIGIIWSSHIKLPCYSNSRSSNEQIYFLYIINSLHLLNISTSGRVAEFSLD